MIETELVTRAADGFREGVFCIFALAIAILMRKVQQ